MWMLDPPARTSSVSAWKNWKHQLETVTCETDEHRTALQRHMEYAQCMINVLSADEDATMNVGLSDEELQADVKESFQGVVYKTFPERKLLWIQCDDGSSVIGCFNRIGEIAASFTPMSRVQGIRTKTLQKVVSLEFAG